MPSLTTTQIADLVGGRLEGAGDTVIHGVESIQRAKADQLTFVRNAKFAAMWSSCNAGAALASDDLQLEAGNYQTLIYVRDADLAMAAVLEAFLPKPSLPPVGVDARATIDPSATISPDASIGPGCVVGPDANIGAGAVLTANVVIGAQSIIGGQSLLHPGVVVGERCRLGMRVILHANAVVGADGFGYRAADDGRGVVKIPQIGTVEIGDDVEIGASTCVDRGKFSATVIGNGTKIDNLCQIAHNCIIGRCCLIAGQVGLAGSVTLGDGVILGGKVAVKDNVTIGSGAVLAGNAAVHSNVPAGEIWGGYPARDAGDAMKEYAALRRLPALLKRLRSK